MSEHWRDQIGKRIRQAKGLMALTEEQKKEFEPLIVHLPIELTNGNDGRGTKWFSSAKLRKQFEVTLRDLGHERTPFSVPVTIELTRILGPRQQKWDADSILRGNAKELIDALVAVGWFVDDSPKYVTAVTAVQDAGRRDEGPSVVVKVEALVEEKRLGMR